MKIKKIETDKQYKEMLALAESLMNAEKGSVEGKKLDLVVSAIEDHERLNINLNRKKNRT